MGDRLATIDIGRKLGGCAVPLLGGLGRDLPPYQPSGILVYTAVCPQQTWAENLGVVPLGGGSRVPI